MKPSLFKVSFIIFCGLFVFSALAGRLFYLQIIRYNDLKARANAQTTRIVELPARRGNIYDRNLVPLALSRTVYTCYATPFQIENKSEVAGQLSRALGLPYQSVLKKVSSSYGFMYIKRKVPRPTYEKVKALKLPGINFIKEEQRVYPEGDLAGQVLGFVGIDNQGLGGIEYSYDASLKGHVGKMRIDGDPIGHQIISGVFKELESPVDGDHVILTLDRRIQYVTQEALKEGVENVHANAGYAIVMVPSTGEILAMVGIPGFDPNHPDDYSYAKKKNPCISDVFEPGSIFKLITVSAVLDEQIFQPDSILMSPKTLKLGSRTIKEAHADEGGDHETVSQIIQKSLNVGTSLMAMKLGKEKLGSYIHGFHFGKKYRFGLPGESRGIYRPVSEWTAVDIAMHSFGQGIAVTPIQIASAVSGIANGGTIMQPKVVGYTMNHSGGSLIAIPTKSLDRVVSEKTAKKVRMIMRAVVEKGTGKSADVRGYSVAGKTGTAQKPAANGRGYSGGEYVSSFIGILPVEKPQILVLVVIDTPRTVIWGSVVAAPLFHQISRQLIDYLDIVPDVPAKEAPIAAH